MLSKVLIGVTFASLFLAGCGGDDGTGTGTADAAPAAAGWDVGTSAGDEDGGTTGGDKTDDPAADAGSGTSQEDAAPVGADSGATVPPADAAPVGTGSIGSLCGADSECGAGQMCLKVKYGLTHGTCTIPCAGWADCEGLSTGGSYVMCLTGWWSETDAQGTTTTHDWQACEFLCGPGQGTCPAGHSCQGLSQLMICIPE